MEDQSRTWQGAFLAKISQTSGSGEGAGLGRLRSGLCEVRMTKITNVCVPSDSTNHPVWKSTSFAWKKCSRT